MRDAKQATITPSTSRPALLKRALAALSFVVAAVLIAALQTPTAHHPDPGTIIASAKTQSGALPAIDRRAVAASPIADVHARTRRNSSGSSGVHASHDDKHALQASSAEHAYRQDAFATGISIARNPPPAGHRTAHHPRDPPPHA